MAQQQSKLTNNLAPPAPKKMGWGKRIGYSALLVLVALLGLHTWWGHHAQVQLDAALAEIRARHEPVAPEDLNSAPIPDAENAAVDLLAAAAALDETQPLWKEFDQLETLRPLQLPLTENERQIIQNLVKASAATMTHLSSAATKPAVDWKIEYHSPLIDCILGSGFSAQRHLASLAKAAALEAHASGDDARAIALIGQILAIDRAIDHQPMVVSHLVATGITSLATAGVDQIAPDLRIGSDEHCVSERLVRALIVELLDEQTVQQAFQHAWQGERVMQLDMANLILRQKMNFNPSSGQKQPLPAPVTWFLRPFILTDARILGETCTTTELAIRQPDLASCWLHVPSTKNIEEHYLIHFLAAMLMPPTYTHAKHYLALARRRLAATQLAIRLYTLHNDGKFPAALADLVSDGYLPAVPNDPMISMHPLMYLPRENDPILYSVGEDGVDNAGREMDPHLSVSQNRRLGEDTVVHLIRQPRPAPPGAEIGDQ